MKTMDQRTQERLNIPAVVLMERAALAVADEVQKEKFDLTYPVILSGCGNNGADGLAVARILKERGVSPVCFLVGEAREGSLVPHQLKSLQAYGVPVECGSAQDALAFIKSRPLTLVIDALFGVGLSREPDEAFCDLIRTINSLPCKTVAVDMPTGVCADSGRILGEAFDCDLTVTFGYLKCGQFLYPGCEKCGKTVLAPIGIDPVLPDEEADLLMLEASDLSFTDRKSDGNKGTFGKVLLIVGSKETGGAAVLAATSAMRSGAGMVRVVTHQNNREVILKALPEAMITVYEEEVPDLSRDLAWADVIGIGCGIGTGDAAVSMLEAVIEDQNHPLVLDADALNILAKREDLMQRIRERKAETIITPHVAEFARLYKKEIREVSEDLRNAAKGSAASDHVICVLKDARTMISDGKVTYINTTGNAGMATAGSGDVLLGLIASLLGQGLTALLAAAEGCFVHGMAGDRVASATGQASLLASDLPDAFGPVLEIIRSSGGKSHE